MSHQNDAGNDSGDIKEMIIEAASSLYEKKGFHETSVGEISDTAGISVPVTYSYVQRKADIMLLIMDDFSKRFEEEVLPEIKPLESPKEKLARAMEIFFNLVDHNMVKVILLYRESRTLDKSGRKKIMAAEMGHVGIFEDILKMGVEQGVFKPHDTDLVAHNILMAGHTWALKYWHYKKRFGLGEYLRLQREFFIDSVSV